MPIMVFHLHRGAARRRAGVHRARRLVAASTRTSSPAFPDFVILHRMAGGIDSFPLLAVPFFILAGNLMNSAGITNRIYDFAVALAAGCAAGSRTSTSSAR